MKVFPYLRLMRIHKPIGFLLLWFPTAWALWVAYAGNPPWSLILLFLSGSFCMRSAGCVINDIADRHIDLHVKRTQSRPLTAGEIGLSGALLLLSGLLFFALLLLTQLPSICFYYALAAVLTTAVYPFCKRFMQAPQLILGFAFSLGIPIVFAAEGTLVNKPLLYLVIINFLWIVTYDTQYAMVDREDDLLIGVKSTAILFAAYDRLIIGLLQFLFHMLWLVLAWSLNYSSLFLLGWLSAAVILLYQQKLIANRQPTDCLRAFSTNALYGLIMWLTIMQQ